MEGRGAAVIMSAGPDRETLLSVVSGLPLRYELDDRLPNIRRAKLWRDGTTSRVYSQHKGPPAVFYMQDINPGPQSVGAEFHLDLQGEWAVRFSKMTGRQKRMEDAR